MPAVDFLAKADGTELRALTYPNLPLGAASAAQRVLVSNLEAETITFVRMYAILATCEIASVEAVLGGADVNLVGQEAMDERWLEARCIASGNTGSVNVNMASPSEGSVPYVPIGGAYGLVAGGDDEDPDSYLAIPDLDPGQVALVEVRVNLPASVTTERETHLAFGVSWKPGEG